MRSACYAGYLLHRACPIHYPIPLEGNYTNPKHNIYDNSSSAPLWGSKHPTLCRWKAKLSHGFRRGSKELGIPTANVPVDDNLTPWIAGITSGVYFG